jgi:hypothetical protein
MADSQQQPDPSLDQSIADLQNMHGIQGMPNISPETLAKFQAFLEQPALKKYAAVVTNPEFTADAAAVLQHPQLKHCGQWELGWIVVMLVFRSWWMSKATHWLKGLMISLCTLLLYWTVAAIGIPSYFLNPAFMKLVKDTWRLLS